MNPIELAQPGISVTDSWQEAGGVAVARTLPKHDIRSEKDRAWRRHAREQARRSGRVAGLLGVDATAVVAGLLAAVLFAPALFSARVLVSQEYYLLPQDTFPAFLTLQILLLAATAAYAGKATSAYGRIAAASILASILFYAGLTLYTDLGITRPAMLLVGGSVLSMLTMGRWLVRRLNRAVRRAGLGLRKVALITTPDGATKDSERMARQRENHVRVCETVVVDRPTNGGRQRALLALDRISRDASVAGIVVSVDAPPKLVRAVANGCYVRGLPVFLVPPFLEMMSTDLRLASTGPITILELVRPMRRLPHMTLKHAIDVLGAAIGLILLAPLFAIIGTLIKLDSRGPIFFWQTRVGLGGQPFKMLKLRTMVDGADERKEEVAHLNGSGDWRLFKIDRDPRVTRVGYFLRKYSLDELPQLFNVLKREMSLVGPRPFFADDLDMYEPHHFQRYSVLPGITGQWQVNGRSHVQDFESVVAQDLEYIRNWSIGLDIKILFRTIPAVFRAQGAM